MQLRGATGYRGAATANVQSSEIPAYPQSFPQLLSIVRAIHINKTPKYIASGSHLFEKKTMMAYSSENSVVRYGQKLAGPGGFADPSKNS